jgi:hypothetical protein
MSNVQFLGHIVHGRWNWPIFSVTSIQLIGKSADDFSGNNEFEYIVFISWKIMCKV